MTTQTIAETEALVRTAARLERVGLMLDRTALSPASRRAVFALQCLRCADRSEPKRAPIGFPYPNAR